MQAAAQQQQQRNGVSTVPQAQSQSTTAASTQNTPAQTNNNMQSRIQAQNAAMQNGVPNGANMAANMQMPSMQGVPQAQMQAGMMGQGRVNSPENMRMMMQQRQLSAAAAQAQAMQLQHLSQPGNLANAHLTGGSPLGAQNAAYLAMQKQMLQNGMNRMPSASPQMNAAGTSGPQQLSSGHTPAIKQLSANIQAQNPQLSHDQVNRLAIQQLQGQMSHRQNALNAAAGATVVGMGGNMGMNMGMNMNMANMANMNMGMGMNGNFGQMYGQNGSPQMANIGMMGGHGQGSVSPVQHYANAVRMQQQQQQVTRQMAGSPSMGMSMNMGGSGSRSATPQQGHQRVGSGSAMESSLSPIGRPASMHGPAGGSVAG